MIQRIRQSRLLPSLVAALVAATMAGGVATAVTDAKADAETITMCVSALGTKIRFVHTSADCNSSELVRTWNVEGPEGPRGSRGLRGNTGATGPTGPSGPAGVAGTPASSFSGGIVADTGQDVPFYVAAGATPGNVVLASSTFTVPNSSHVYYVGWTTTEAIPDATAGCVDNARDTVPSIQVAVNGVVNATITASEGTSPGSLTPVVLPVGTNVVQVQAAQGRCTTGAIEAGGTASVTLRRLVVIMG